MVVLPKAIVEGVKTLTAAAHMETDVATHMESSLQLSELSSFFHEYASMHSPARSPICCEL